MSHATFRGILVNLHSCPPRAHSRAVYFCISAVGVLLAAVWLIGTIGYGHFNADASGISMVQGTHPADGEKNVLPTSFVSAYLNAGNAIDPHSLNSRTVRLYRAKDHQSVAARMNTSAAGDNIVVQPIDLLETSTKYVFEVNGVKDTGGAELLPFQMSFTTSGGIVASNYSVAFEKADLLTEREHFTALAIGPDHRLYAGTAAGNIIACDIKSDGSFANKNIIRTILIANHGPRLITGIRFDPTSTVQQPKLWVSHGQLCLGKGGEFSLEGATEWTGKISVLSGPKLTEYRDVIINLPRSYRDHLNNQLDFGPDGCIYFSQGSHTAMGSPDRKWGSNRVERLLSGAVLRADVSKISGTLDVKTPDGGGTYDPFAPGAPLTIFASGVRVGYDMLWHSNGHLYTAINGSSAGGNTPGTPLGRVPRRIDDARFGSYDGPVVVPLKDVPAVQPDLLLKLERGAYYGHPNPARGEYVLNGGNPTSDVDPLEVASYPVGTRPDRNFHLPAYNFGTSVSPNGIIEYKGSAFGGKLNGKLLITRYSGGKDIIVLTPGDDGDIIESITGIAGLTGFVDPLDLIEDTDNGNIYVAEFGGEKLSLLRPVNDPVKAAAMNTRVFRQELQ
jgi:glucose/arabinose dehydrogenase